MSWEPLEEEKSSPKTDTSNWEEFKVSSNTKPKMKFGVISNSAQLAGNVAGYGLGGRVGHPIVGSSIGGTLTRPMGNLMEMGLNRVAQQPNTLGKIAEGVISLNPMTAPIAPVYLSPEEKNMMLKDMAQTAKFETLSMPLKYVSGRVVNAVVGAGQNMFSKLGTKFGVKVRHAFYAYKDKMSKSWEGEVEKLSTANPNKVVDIKDVGTKVSYLWNDLTQEAKSAFNKSPILKKIVSGTQEATELSLKQVNQIISDLGQVVRKVNPKNFSKYVDVKDVLTDLKAVRMNAFPEMAKVSADYASKINPWNAIHSYMRFGKTMSGIKGGMFKDPELVEAVKTIFPKNIVSQMKGIRDADVAGKLLKNPLTYLTGAGIYGIKQFLGGEE